MNVAFICHDPATGQVTVHELPTLAVIEPCVDAEKNNTDTSGNRQWCTEVKVRLADGSTMFDTSAGHAIMEVLGMYAEDEGIPRWRRRAARMPVPGCDEKSIVHPAPRRQTES